MNAPSRGGATIMRKLACWRGLCAIAFGLVLAGLSTGCQTWTYQSGMTLPSGHYLQHPPQYIPPSPDFPLSRELATMESQGVGSTVPPGAAAQVLPPIPGVAQQ